MLRAEATKKKGKGGKGAASDLASPLLTLLFLRVSLFQNRGGRALEHALCMVAEEERSQSGHC